MTKFKCLTYRSGELALLAETITETASCYATNLYTDSRSVNHCLHYALHRAFHWTDTSFRTGLAKLRTRLPDENKK